MGGFFAGMKKEPPRIIVKAAPKYVNTVPVVYSDVDTRIVTFGRVESAEPIDLIAEVSGRILPGSVALKEGQDFRKGNLLFRLEDDESRFNLKSQKSNFLRDLATILPDLKIDFPESYPIWSAYFESIDINESLPEMPQYQTDQEKTFLATKNIFSNYFDIKRAETNLSKHLVYAPFAGSFSDVFYEPGAFVSPGSKIGRIVRSGKLELIVPVDASDITWIKEGASVEVSTEDGSRSWEGRIQRIGEVVNQTTHSIDVSIEIISNENLIYDGLYLKAEIPGVVIPDAMEIDRSAVYSGSEVFTVENDSILKVIQINPRRVNSKTVIFNGPDEGEILVIEPLINAHNNMIVTTLRDTIANAPSPKVASGK
ncbi:MAG: RND transporter [Cyclobacteriaceae bacterium]|nr:MAG: RND transporter [Cyclobacteriaceae bacterium]